MAFGRWSTGPGELFLVLRALVLIRWSKPAGGIEELASLALIFIFYILTLKAPVTTIVVCFVICL